MKNLILIFILLVSNLTYAKGNALLRCLAKEEEQLHKNKDQSALYKLNQTFLNELASNNDITIKNSYVDKICNDKTTTPSIELLHLLLINESDIYDTTLKETDASLKDYKKGYINEFQKQVPHFLITFLAQLQAEISDPNCFNRAIPEIAYLNEKIKYLEEEISMHQIISEKKKIENIFKKLKERKSIMAKCEIDSEKKLKLLMKKSKNTDSPKN